MLEVYEILYKGIPCGELHYDTEKDQFKAVLTRRVRGQFPARLFTINGKEEVTDEVVKRYIRNSVAPRTRENIRQILNDRGLKRYSEWGLFKANRGENANDYASIKFKYSQNGVRKYGTD